MNLKKLFTIVSILINIFFSPLLATPTQEEMQVIGKRIWMNECAGKVEGLTTWNKGEDFASLGIGHFIWYPQGYEGPFEEIFPKYIKFLQKKNIPVSDYLTGACPWKDREHFQKEMHSEKMQELRSFLVETIPQQIAFIEERLLTAFPKVMEKYPSFEKVKIQFDRMVQAPGGFYPLIDYINFKGEGIKVSERYNGEGWGLLQVLENMKTTTNPLKDFADSAAEMLTRRVKNSPPERHEERWLNGWLKRCASYTQN